MTQPLMPSSAPALGLTTSEPESSDSAFTARADPAALDKAFSRVVEEQADFAYNVAYRMLRNVEDAEDAVQEAFISAYRAFHRFKGESKVSTWLYRIVVNACLMKIRKEKSRSNYLTETGYNDDIIQDWGNDPEQAAINGELRDVVESGLERLSPELRAAVVLRDVQGLTTEEGAAALELSVAPSSPASTGAGCCCDRTCRSTWAGARLDNMGLGRILSKLMELGLDNAAGQYRTV